VDGLKAVKRIVSLTLVAVAPVVLLAGSGQAQEARWQSQGAKQPRVIEVTQDAQSQRHWDGQHRGSGDHHFDRGHHRHGRVPLVYWGYPYYSYRYAYPHSFQEPEYWYYCPTYQAFYPDLWACPVPWVLIPAP